MPDNGQLITNFFQRTQYLHILLCTEAGALPFLIHTAMTTYRPILAFCLLALMFSVSSCDAIGTIFKAGAWTGLIGVFLVVLLLWFIVTKMRSR